MPPPERTDIFNITGDKFRVTWSTTGGTWTIFECNLKGSETGKWYARGMTVKSFPDSGTFVIQRSGSFYFDVTAVDTIWVIRVQEFK